METLGAVFSQGDTKLGKMSQAKKSEEIAVLADYE
jgi:hypothetical protein